MKQTPNLAKSDGYDWAVELVEQAQHNLRKAQAVLEKEKLECGIICASCGEISPIKTQVYVQTYWYTSPYGCTGGDYWNIGEAHWYCPSCRFQNRFEDNKDLYQTIANDFHRPELVELKRFFKYTRECYCEHNKRPCKSCLAEADSQKLYTPPQR